MTDRPVRTNERGWTTGRDAQPPLTPELAAVLRIVPVSLRRTSRCAKMEKSVADEVEGLSEQRKAVALARVRLHEQQMEMALQVMLIDVR